jgi:putative ABC transport system permease protein
LMNELNASYPGFNWVDRIRFTGLMDFPDVKGETRVQGPAVGWAVNLFNSKSKEKNRLNIEKSIIVGKIPSNPGEALISYDFAKRYGIKTGDEFTLFGSAMDGSMSFMNFKVSGLVRFGTSALDRGAMIIDITDARETFKMDDAASEILGFLKSGYYDDFQVRPITEKFNNKYKKSKDEFAPLMINMRNQGGIGEYIDYVTTVESMMVFIFILAMSIVLWNAGLLGGLRRYKEFGVRLALGEEKKHIYRTLILEGIFIGLIGSVAGTAIGLGASYYLQAVGIDFGGMLKNSSMLIPSVLKASVTPMSFVIGFIPGLFSTVLGNALSGLGIYRRQTARLFNELEV